jgi:hypothetical protein
MHRSVLMVLGLQVWGPLVRETSDSFFDRHPEFEEACFLAGTAKGPDPKTQEVVSLRGEIQTQIDAGLAKQGLKHERKGPPEDCTLAADLLSSWATLTADPSTLTSDWFWDGAPAGITKQPEIGDDLFPPVTEDDPEPPENLITNFSEFRNYKGVEEDSDCEKELTAFSKRSPPFLERCRNLKKVRKFLKGDVPVLSKFGLIVRTKKGRTKKRIILDVKESKVAASTRRKYRALLPRVIGVVNDLLLAAARTASSPEGQSRYLLESMLAKL